MSIEPLAAGTGRCEITGKVVPEDELVTLNGQRVCAEGKQILLERLKAGEAVPGELERPSVLLRFACWFIDGIIVAVPSLIIYVLALLGFGVAMTAGATAEPTLFMGITSVAVQCLAICYFGLMHGLRGQTLGKMAGKIKVVRMDDRPMDLKTGFIRALAYDGPSVLVGIAVIARALTLVQGINIVVGLYVIVNAVAALVDRNTQRAIHDRIAGTRVVKIPA